jgi:hypothetical protein
MFNSCALLRQASGGKPVVAAKNRMGPKAVPINVISGLHRRLSIPKREAQKIGKRRLCLSGNRQTGNSCHVKKNAIS